MKEYEIWSEGFACSGDRGNATFHGKQNADSFEEACDIFFNGNELYRGLLAGDRKTKIRAFWGCRLFDNEIDAKKSFG